MVQRRGEKNGIKTSATLKETQNGMWSRNAKHQGIVVEDGKSYSLEKRKNWEILEKAPKIQPKEDKKDRIERNKKEKKKEFQEHLKVRGKHKEPPQKKDDSQNKDEKDEEKKEKREDEEEEEEEDVKVGISYFRISRLNNPPQIESKIHVYIPPTEKDYYLRKQQRDENNIDFYRQGKNTFEKSKRDTSLDFKVK